MIIEKESEIKLLRNFCENPFDFFSIAEIGKATKISRNWVYKITNKLKKFGILQQSGKKYKLDLSVPFCKRLKQLFDSEYIHCLQPETKNSIFNTANKIAFETNPKSIVLVGSVAANKQKKESDIDFLVIDGKKAALNIENYNIIRVSEKQFKEKYLKGDDFIISALLFGKTIEDKNTFIRFFESPLPIFSQETIQEKIKYCEKLKERIYALLKTDEKKATEELLYLALQAGRITLLKNKITPKTKYDLAKQVKPFNKKTAEIIEETLKKQKLSKEKIINHIKECMNVTR